MSKVHALGLITYKIYNKIEYLQNIAMTRSIFYIFLNLLIWHVVESGGREQW